MKTKKSVLSCIGAILLLAVLSGCTKKAPAAKTPVDPMDKITQGYYMYEYNTAEDGSGMSMTNYFHFYEDAPVLGRVFYAGFAMNQITFTGTYTVEKADYAYSCYPDRAAAIDGALSSGTAPYTITCYDFEGTEIARMGFDGDNVYNDAEKLSCVSTKNNVFLFDAGGEKFSETYKGEVGQKYLDFVAPDDPTSMLTLYHNKTYTDMVNMMVDGTWEMASAADGYSYTLTPLSAGDTAATLAVSSDKVTAVYTPATGSAVNMVNTAHSGPKAKFMLTGSVPIPGQDGLNADVLGSLYEDSTVTLTASLAGFEITLDEGTWSVAENGFTFTFDFTNAGVLTSGLGATGAELNYVGVNGMLGAVDTVLTLGFAN